MVAPAKPAIHRIPIEIVTCDFADAGAVEPLVADRPDTIFHLAAIVSGEAEAHFDKGYRINLDGTPLSARGDPRASAAATSRGWSSLRRSRCSVRRSLTKIGDEFFLTPLTSYGTQKSIGELLLADYSRKGFLNGIGIRLPTICVRPGKPNKARLRFLLQHPP